MLNVLKDISSAQNGEMSASSYMVLDQCIRHALFVPTDFGVALAPFAELLLARFLELLIGAVAGQAPGCQ